MSQGFTLEELARRTGGQVEGDGTAVLTGLAAMETARADQLTFAADARRAKALAASSAGGAIVSGDFQPIPASVDRPRPMALLRVKNVQAAVAAVLAMLDRPADLPPAGVHPSAVVAADAVVEAGAAIGPNVTVGSAARIAAGAVLCANVVVEAGAIVGEGTVLYPGTVVIARSKIGRRCRIGPAAVIGSSGFGYYFDAGRHNPVPHVGTVEIGDDVDIGACSCVDRAKFDVTRIGQGTKIDNLVQVAHNVQVGANCLLVSQVGIAGSAVLKDYVVLGGHAGVRDNITIGQGVQAAAFAAIAQDVPDGQTICGLPAVEAKRFFRVYQAGQSVPELKVKVRELEKRLEELESKLKTSSGGTV